MPVYFIRAGAEGLVKIGHAHDPEKRRRDLQTGSAEPLKIIRVIEGGHKIEAWLQQHFAALRQRGEWFTYSDEMLSIEPWARGGGSEPLSAPVSQPPCARLQDARRYAGYSSAASFARAIGVSPVTYRAHESGQNDLSGDHAATYARHLGVCPAWLLFGDPYPREGPSEAGPTPIGVVWATPDSIENERKSHG